MAGSTRPISDLLPTRWRRSYMRFPAARSTRTG
jgi:hypothetical protein